MGWWNVGAAAITIVGSVISANSAANTAGVAQQAADLQWDIANRIQQRDEELQAIWRAEYRDGELSLRSRVSQLRPTDIPYDRMGSSVRSEMRRQFSNARATTLTTIASTCTLPPAGLINDISIMQAGAESWAGTGMIRAEEGLRRALDAQHRAERMQMAQVGRGAYFKPGGGEMAAQIARQLQAQASAAASQQAGAAGRLATMGFQYAQKAAENWNSTPEITTNPSAWEYDSAMPSSASTQQATTTQNSTAATTQIQVPAETQQSEGGGGGSSGGGGILDIFDIF